MTVKFYDSGFDSCIELIFDSDEATVKEYIYHSTQHIKSDTFDCKQLSDAIFFVKEVYKFAEEISSQKFTELVDTRFL